ncbi:hypothetical protein BHE74_00024958 [Ensete ventricosum]|nr:hypothetical protein GW17_00011670 [Ensete ventricosum]RWW67581.1 hypothetical protein BHE74_00024958 [Ensete ventricosum]RZR76139.1 hypothetical protein BHM03_00000763 [Ensete ventricosum]
MVPRLLHAPKPNDVVCGVHAIVEICWAGHACAKSTIPVSQVWNVDQVAGVAVIGTDAYLVGGRCVDDLCGCFFAGGAIHPPPKFCLQYCIVLLGMIHTGPIEDRYAQYISVRCVGMLGTYILGENGKKKLVEITMIVMVMGSNYKAALLPQSIRDTIHGWGKAARKRRKHRRGMDESTIHTETSTVCSIEEDEQELLEDPSDHSYIQIELQPSSTITTTITNSDHPTVSNGGSTYNNDDVALLHSLSVPSSPALSGRGSGISRCASMPNWRGSRGA